VNQAFGTKPSGNYQDLSTVEASALAPLLEEEAGYLWERLRWATGRGAEERQGLAWVEGGAVRGLLTLGANSRIVMLGRLFASRQGDPAGVERLLLEGGLACAEALGARNRICGDLLVLEPATRQWLAQAWPSVIADRLLLERPREPLPPEEELPEGWTLVPWEDRWLDAAAGLLVAAYGREGDPTGALASTPEAALQALARTVQHQDCGSFLPGASFLARENATGRMEGLMIACRMGPDQGHVAQVATAPWAQGRGIARVLVGRSLRAMAAQGCHRTHLAVDADNPAALALYRRLGFREIHRFCESRPLKAG
jgi:ribosomal protein S18 acetylase RimI-like enzyme